MKIIVNGALGRMGREVTRLVKDGYKGAELCALVDAFGQEDGVLSALDSVAEQADVIVDFSNHAAAPAICEYAVKTGTATVIATTGHTEEEKAAIFAAAKKVPIFFSANMSLGVALLCELAAKAAALYPDADTEIVETHHNRKLDAPSGTALMIADSIKEVKTDATYQLGRAGHAKREPREIGIHAIRMGNVVGEHEVHICTDTETITISHKAHDRALFAEGALVAAAFLQGKSAGLYTMRDMVSGK